MMGLFGSIGNVIKSAANTAVGKTITKALDTISGVVTNPVTAITQGLGASTQKFVEAKPITNIVKTVTNVGVAAGAVVGIGAIAEGGFAAVAKGAQAIIPSTTKGKVIAAVAAPVVVGAVIKEPAKAAETALNAPSKLANFGGNLAEVITNPSIEGAKQLVKENPIIAGAAGVAVATGVGLGVGGLVSTISNIQNTQAVKENTKASLGGSSPEVPIAQTVSSLPVSVVDKSGEFKTPPAATGIAQLTPVTPQTQKISSGVSKKRYKPRKQAKMQPISQKVNVIVSNRSVSTGTRINAKYINREVLAY